jgi:hypothetical protein
MLYLTDTPPPWLMPGGGFCPVSIGGFCPDPDYELIRHA